MDKNERRGFDETISNGRNNMYAVPRIIAVAERAGHLYAILYCAGKFGLLSRAKHKNRAYSRSARRHKNCRRGGNKVVSISKTSQLKEAKKKLTAKPKRKKWEKPAQAKKPKPIPTTWQGYPKKVPVLKSHKFQDIADYNMKGSLVCFLSGEPIVRQKDITTEHFVPKSLADKNAPNYAEMHAIVTSQYNLHPAIKIINNIKGNLLPCEWEQQKSTRVYKALENYSLDPYERGLLQKLLAVWATKPQQGKPCQKCALWLYQRCNGNQHIH